MPETILTPFDGSTSVKPDTAELFDAVEIVIGSRRLNKPKALQVGSATPRSATMPTCP
jgi:hypothetical protein